MRHVALHSLALAALLAACAASVAYGGTPAQNHAATAAGHCKLVAKGTAWRYKGQKGTAYTIEGNRATACAVGKKWLVRLTTMTGFPQTPRGWDCITAVSVAGQCETRAGAIFAWTAKLK